MRFYKNIPILISVYSSRLYRAAINNRYLDSRTNKRQQKPTILLWRDVYFSEKHKLFDQKFVKYNFTK